MHLQKRAQRNGGTEGNYLLSKCLYVQIIVISHLHKLPLNPYDSAGRDKLSSFKIKFRKCEIICRRYMLLSSVYA